MKNAASTWKRHTLVWLTDDGRRYAADHIHTTSWNKDSQNSQHKNVDLWKQQLVCDPLVPGIICRQPSGISCLSSSGISDSSPAETDRNHQYPQHSDTFLAGFSYWKYDNGSRLRMTAEIYKESVRKTCSPVDLCAPDKRDRLCTAYPLLSPIFAAADKCHIKPGLFGSTALEWVTGYPYRNQNSDLDLYLLPLPGCDLQGFGHSLSLLEAQSGVRLDAEIELTGGYGVKLKELLSPSKTVLGKGLYDVVLFEKSTIMDSLFI